ncbi:MAG: L,D-transpeptidase family protein [Lachnospiraceae bacterium]|nr:L,D-transpeptidase family protein [Lachnospiraceae bacterium]
MKRKPKKAMIVSLTLTAAMAALLAGYVVQAGSYTGKYISGTVINGVDVSGMTASEAKAAISEKNKVDNLTITFADGTTETISGSSIGLVSNSEDEEVTGILDSQDKLAWIAGHLGRTSSYTVTETKSYDAGALKIQIDSLPELPVEDATLPTNAHMEMAADGTLSIVPETSGTAIDEPTLVASVENALNEGKTSYTVSGNDYAQPAVTSDDEDLNTQVNDLNGFTSTVITYTLHTGETMTLDRSTLKDWLSVREDDPTYYYINTDVLQEKCREYAAEIAAKDNEERTTRTFHSTARGDVEVSGKAYGYIVDEDATADQLYQALLARGNQSLTPVYSDSSLESGGIGSTYIEVDLANQHLWYYVDGSLYYECDFVSGLAGDPERETPTGVYHIFSKETDRDLKGPLKDDGQPSYVSHVDFWMPFNGNVGLHNAPWRSSFGGSIYKYSGSHGCINLSYDSAQTIYNEASVGTTVVVF